ncbi:biotin/lipoyl-binding protein [Anaerocolumna sedimenticola]|uniref:Biotin/lipoyl-binding protein n=1 Tax=Anaerocolumna sedimenticola TaxID=2696063 RepID=A0A6P1TPE9_9FIRM|nr:acetyl-CoA carboxylase biotin carboxyl carrier protein subunit [Anaerocolumna sedimenticola]QHQ62207.1 biotin/lipoyl-binding protein [Anaerocolumna sedimenticola]
MKNYTITVNGTAYQVTVQEGFTSTFQAAPVAAPVAAAPAPVAAAPAPAPAAAAPAPAAAPAAPQGSAGNIKVNAPMPGKILAIKASVGQTVKRGEVLLILEAMKMENEIVSPEDGTVASINVSSGDMVESSTLLATLN